MTARTPRPVDRRGSNAARMLGGMLVFTFCILAFSMCAVVIT